MRRFLILWAIAGLALPAWAEPPADALQWLQRVASAAQKLTYAGTFIYQSGSRTEISRITHVVEAGNELERLEVLDGSPREVLRYNDVVKCFLPESRLLIVERRKGRQAQTFPALLPASLAGLTEHYVIRKGATGRVAGFESQSVLIEPKDDLRYGHQFWIDSNSGLLLKAGLVGERGELLETFAFTELRIGGPVDRSKLKPRTDMGGGDWKVLDVRTNETRGENDAWLFRTPLPGFRKVVGMKRQVEPDAPEMTHIVFSDGLAAISVFVEPLRGSKPETGAFAMGAVNAYKRVAGDYLFVLMGDVPPASLKKLAEGIEVKQK
ncbi:MAG: MucB/RseB C-terminal domain-containing protein [Rhodocyclaceae bacterium]|nr:MucB/RseB C-terminal domain-containing protein [Rhodocyclaceae bacterium]